MNENISINDSYWFSSAVNDDDVHHHQGLFPPNISDDELSPLMPQWAYKLASVYLSFVTFMGLTLNGAIIIAIIRDPQRTPLNWMLLNLAFSDGIISAFGTPISAVAAAKGGWHLSHEMCVTYAMVMSITGIASITILCVLALWRCTLVVFSPVKRRLTGARGQVGSRQAALLSLLIWSYAGAVTAPPLLGWGRYDLEAAHISCSVNWESRMDNNRSYIIYLFSLGLIVPLAIIIASYLSIIHVVRKTKKMKRKLIRQQFSSTSPPMHVSTTEGAERRITMMVACMVGTFIVSWTPYSVLALMETFGNFTISPAIATIPSLFAKTSVVFNPLVYGLLNTQFRSAFSSTFCFPLNQRGISSSPSNYNGNGVPGVNEEDCERPVVIGNNTARPSPTIQMEMNTIPTAAPNNDESEERKETLICIREKTSIACIVDKTNAHVSTTIGPAATQSRHHNEVIVNMDSFDTGYTSNNSSSTCKNQTPILISNNHHLVKNTVLIANSCLEDDPETGDVVVSKTECITAVWPRDDDSSNRFDIVNDAQDDIELVDIITCCDVLLHNHQHRKNSNSSSSYI